MNTEIINYDRAIIEFNIASLEAKGWEFPKDDYPNGKARYFFVDGKLERALYVDRKTGKFPYSGIPLCEHDELIEALSDVEVKIIEQYNYPDSPRNFPDVIEPEFERGKLSDYNMLYAIGFEDYGPNDKFTFVTGLDGGQRKLYGVLYYEKVIWRA